MKRNIIKDDKSMQPHERASLMLENVLPGSELVQDRIREVVRNTIQEADYKKRMQTGPGQVYFDLFSGINACEPQDQVTWLLKSGKTGDYIQAVIALALEHERQARDFLENTEITVSIHDALATTILDVLHEKATGQSSPALDDLEILESLAEDRAAEIDKRDPESQVAWLLGMGFPRNELKTRLDNATVQTETPVP